MGVNNLTDDRIEALEDKKEEFKAVVARITKNSEEFKSELTKGDRVVLEHIKADELRLAEEANRTAREYTAWRNIT